MSRAQNLIDRIEEISYLGQHDDYGDDAKKDQDAKEYMEPFDDLELPDGSKVGKNGDKDRQMKSRPNKSTAGGKGVK